MATQIKFLYSELYAINTEIHKATDAEIKGAISRVTGKDEDGVGRIYNTFKALCNNADFDMIDNGTATLSEIETKANDTNQSQELASSISRPQFHYNIQIHLPATNDISVYNSIFKSLKDNLLM